MVPLEIIMGAILFSVYFFHMLILLHVILSYKSIQRQILQSCKQLFFGGTQKVRLLVLANFSAVGHVRQSEQRLLSII